MDELTPQQAHEVLAGRVNDAIEALEAHMLEHAQLEIPVTERFVDGMYVREIEIPAGTLLTGRVYTAPYVDIMLAGDITVATPEGTKRFTGHNVMDGAAGRKRAGYAHADTRWVTVHRTDKVAPEEMVEHLSFFSMTEFRAYKLEQDRASYEALIADMGMTEAEVREQVEATDQVGLPAAYAPLFEIAASPIEGLGVVARYGFPQGAEIGPARIQGQRTELGRYVNHSAWPNAAKIPLDNGDVATVAIASIAPGEEITADYRDTVAALWAAEEG